MQDMKIPNHVAIILDGNGRWAKSKGMPRTYGHTTGAKNVEKLPAQRPKNCFFPHHPLEKSRNETRLG